MNSVITQLAGLTAALTVAAEESPRGIAMQPLKAANERLLVVGIGLIAGSELPEHDIPGEATIQVLSGAVTLIVDGDETDLLADEIMEIPQARHRVRALGPSTILLTQVKHDSRA
ncbi:MAG: cupin [Microcella sp.]